MGILSSIFKALFPPTEFINVTEEFINVTVTSTLTKNKCNKTEITSTDGNFTLILEDTGNNKIQVIKLIREITGLGLKESKDITDNTPATIKQNIDETTAIMFKRELEAVGAKINLIDNDD